MAKNLKKFENHTEYEAFTASTSFVTPNVSVCTSDDEVHFHPYSETGHSYADDYLTIEAEREGYLAIVMEANLPVSDFEYFEYSQDGGTIWEKMENVDGYKRAVSINMEIPGKKILVRGKGKKCGNGSIDNGFHIKFTNYLTGKVYGNVMSILYADNFKTAPKDLDTNEIFAYLFAANSGLTDASNLVLPATGLSQSCYSRMFYNCEELTTAPELPALTLVNNCYYFMFSGCGKLNHVKAMFLTTPGTDYTWYWLSGVASTGTFVKNSLASWNVSGENGIPNGWSIETA